ncbi:hypothetical protein TKK_0016278 [Trichogramma kaykai]
MNRKLYTIDDFPSLKAKHVHIQDEATVLKKINIMINGGSDKLQVVTDFDFTLTKTHKNGNKTLSSFCIFEKSKQLPEAYFLESQRLLNKYRPIELDPKIPKEEKIKALDEWMSLCNDLYQGLHYNIDELDKLVEEYGETLRDGTIELFHHLKIQEVPVLVFSAGLGDVVKSVLKHHKILHDNVNIVSNFLKFNGNVTEGFQNPEKLLHVYNKNEESVDEKYHELLKERTNILLMGDSLGDANMADGASKESVILRIGFLYHHVEENLPLYRDTFDIVLVDDSTMNIIEEILSPVSKKF